MSLQAGAETVIDQCLAVQAGEHIAVINDGNDEDLIDALLTVLGDRPVTFDYHTYPEPERSGMEPPEAVAEAMREADVFIAPTRKSLSHTRSRRDACAAGARGATMPGITREIWTASLLADYDEVKRLSEAVYDLLRDTSEVHVETPSGTDLTFDVRPGYFHTDTGIIHDPGAFGNLPAGEAFGAPVAASGTLVIDHFPHAPSGTVVEIEGNEAVAVEHPGDAGSELAAAFDEVAGARTVAEFGVGTNPAATLIGQTLQDEKVLGTVHVAFGDSSSMVPDGDDHAVDCDVHWDTVCEEPTVTFDGTTVIDAGEPVFRAR